MPDRRHLLEQYRLVDMARKVVGRRQRRHPLLDPAARGRDGGDPLFLQAKEAHASVLDGVRRHQNAQASTGERVVHGQRLMQAAVRHLPRLAAGRAASTACTRDFYIRQLRDWKGSLPPERMMLRPA